MIEFLKITLFIMFGISYVVGVLFFIVMGIIPEDDLSQELEYKNLKSVKMILCCLAWPFIIVYSFTEVLIWKRNS